jgi:hypothetical protein
MAEVGHIEPGVRRPAEHDVGGPPAIDRAGPLPGISDPAPPRTAIGPPADPLAAQLARCVAERAVRPGSTSPALLQRALIPAGQPGAGRVPPAERGSLKKLLELNGFAGERYTKAMWDPVHKGKLDTFFATVVSLDDAMDQTKAGHKRTRIKNRLADQYEGLLHQAAVAVQDTADQYEDRVERAGAIMENWRKAKGKQGVFMKDWPELKPLTATEWAGLSVLVPEATFMHNAVSAQKRLKTGDQPKPGLTDQQKLRLATEQAAVNTQLAAWRIVQWQPGQQVAGCNANGTWGTSAGGAGAGFAISTVSRPVWAKLEKWWLRKAGAFITASDTSTWSLKMETEEDGRSPLMNYHINVT